MMKKGFVILLILIIPSGIFAFEAGTGISVFVPQTLLDGQEGSVVVEKSLGLGMSFGPFISLPFGVIYNTNYGMTLEGADSVQPWFYGDSLLPYVMVQVDIPMGPVFLQLYGGGALNWNMTLRPLTGNIEEDLSSPGEQVVLVKEDFSLENSLGRGFLAGGTFGVNFGQFKIGLDVLYRKIFHEVKVSGTYRVLDDPLDTVSPLEVEDKRMILEGFSFGISGNISI